MKYLHTMVRVANIEESLDFCCHVLKIARINHRRLGSTTTIHSRFPSILLARRSRCTAREHRLATSLRLLLLQWTTHFELFGSSFRGELEARVEPDAVLPRARVGGEALKGAQRRCGLPAAACCCLLGAGPGDAQAPRSC